MVFDSKSGLWGLNYRSGVTGYTIRQPSVEELACDFDVALETFPHGITPRSCLQRRD
jgi:hypothetical protein